MASEEAGVDRGAGGAAPCGTDPRLFALRDAVDRLRRDLGSYRAPLEDREVAERGLGLLEAATAAGEPPDTAALGRALLLIAAAVGSVSALAPAVSQLCAAAELFGVPRYRLADRRPATR